jgi:hypothetical protein
MRLDHTSITPRMGLVLHMLLIAGKQSLCATRLSTVLGQVRQSNAIALAKDTLESACDAMCNSQPSRWAVKRRNADPGRF